jgi:hypothetical protein
MVQADHINHAQRCPKPVNPPGISCLSQDLPTIKRVPPQLARRAEIIGRDSGHNPRPSVILELKQLWMGPHIGTVVGHKDRDIAENADAPFTTIGPKRRPLPEELILYVLVGFNFFFELLDPSHDRFRAARSDGGVPLVPDCSAVGYLNSCECGVVLEPMGVLLAKAMESVPL